MFVVSGYGNFFHGFFLTEYEHLQREKEECGLQQLTDPMVIRVFFASHVVYVKLFLHL